MYTVDMYVQTHCTHWTHTQQHKAASTCTIQGDIEWLLAAKSVYASRTDFGGTSKFRTAGGIDDVSPVVPAPWSAVVGADDGTVCVPTDCHASSRLSQAETSWEDTLSAWRRDS